VDDCSLGAQALADEGRVDKNCLCIDGGSAGGYTTLACLAFKDVFKAGIGYQRIGKAIQYQIFFKKIIRNFCYLIFANFMFPVSN
jgi:hypothetical protein